MNMTRVTIRLFEEDIVALRTMYPDRGYNEVIRNLVHTFVTKISREAERNAEQNTTPELTIKLPR